MKLATLIALALAALVLVGCGSQSTSGNETQPQQVETRPGSAAVYQRIESLTDCDALQAQFDQADKNHQREADSGDTAMAGTSESRSPRSKLSVRRNRPKSQRRFAKTPKHAKRSG